MPTKLKEPIIIKLETVEDAVSACHRLNIEAKNVTGAYTKDECEPYVNMNREQWRIIEKSLKSAGIDYYKWQPPTPLKAGSYDVEINPDGSIKAGCTTVDRPTLERIFKASTEAMAQEQKEEWPKWFYKAECANGICNLLRMDSVSSGQWHDSRSGHVSTQCGYGWDYIGNQLKDGYIQITRAEASKILGREV